MKNPASWPERGASLTIWSGVQATRDRPRRIWRVVIVIEESGRWPRMKVTSDEARYIDLRSALAKA